ncbi:MAG: hypothetical protein ACOY0T_33760 [Myxococcota bacterium]
MSRTDELDLLIRARQGVLSSGDRVQLDTSLESSAENRLLLRAGLGFDAEGSAQPGDDVLIERLVQRAVNRAAEIPLKERPSRRERRLRRFGPLLVASLYLVLGAIIGVAAAATYFASPWGTPSSPTPKPNEASKMVRSKPQPPSAEPQPLAVASALPEPPAVASNAAAPIPVRKVPRVAESTRPAPSVAATESSPLLELDSAAALYAAANRARVQGDLDLAKRGYLALGARFPNSSEAEAARLTLGNLYLVSGQPELALAQFRAHQTASGTGFGAESAWGVAVALGQLGRREEERRALLDLLARFPGSVYESAARRKLAQPE